MKPSIAAFSPILVVVLMSQLAFAQKSVSLADNEAFRYWSAFSALQD